MFGKSAWQQQHFEDAPMPFLSGFVMNDVLEVMTVTSTTE